MGPDGPHQNMSLAQRDSGEETMSKTVTKADIAKSICAQSEMKQQHAKKVLDAMLGIMKKALKEEKEMLLSGFGKFEAFTKKNRMGRDRSQGCGRPRRRHRGSDGDGDHHPRP